MHEAGSPSSPGALDLGEGDINSNSMVQDDHLSPDLILVSSTRNTSATSTSQQHQFFQEQRLFVEETLNICETKRGGGCICKCEDM